MQSHKYCVNESKANSEFTFLLAKEAQGWNLREGAATEEHDKDDTLSITLWA